MAVAPFGSRATVTICGTYANTRMLLQSAKIVSAMSAGLISISVGVGSRQSSRQQNAVEGHDANRGEFDAVVDPESPPPLAVPAGDPRLEHPRDGFPEHVWLCRSGRSVVFDQGDEVQIVRSARGLERQRIRAGDRCRGRSGCKRNRDGEDFATSQVPCD